MGGNSSVVEPLPSKQVVAGSNPVSRSRFDASWLQQCGEPTGFAFCGFGNIDFLCFSSSIHTAVDVLMHADSEECGVEQPGSSLGS